MLARDVIDNSRLITTPFSTGIGKHCISGFLRVEMKSIPENARCRNIINDRPYKNCTECKIKCTAKELHEIEILLIKEGNDVHETI